MFLSYSQLWAFWTCPRLSHYLSQAPLRLQQSWSQAAGRQGSQVHQALHAVFLQGMSPELVVVQKLQAHYPEIWQHYTQIMTELEQPPVSAAYSEWEGCVPLPEAWSLPYVLTGRFDRLVVQDQVCWVLDWKTGQPRDTDAIHLQLRFYAWLVWQLREAYFPEVTEVRATAHYLQTGHREARILTADRVEEETDFFRTLITAYHGQQQAEIQGIPHPRYTSEGPWCTMCEYQRLCPEGKYHAQ